MTTANFTKPVTSDLRADVLQYIRDMANAQSRMFDGDTLVSPSTGVIRYTLANNRFEKWNGSTWDVLNITGNVTPTPPGGSTGDIQYNAGGGNFGGDSIFSWSTGAKQLTIGNFGSMYITGGNTFLGLKDSLGGFLVYANTSAGTWRRGMTALKNSDETRMSGFGFIGSNESVTAWRAGLGVDWWDPASVVNGIMIKSGNVAISTGAEPTAWSASFRALEIGAPANAFWSEVNGNNTWLTSNLYYSAADAWTYARTAVGWALGVGIADAFQIRRAPSGTAGTTATPVVVFEINSVARVSWVGGARIAIQNSTDGGNANGIFMWNAGDHNWGIYMGQPGATKSLSGGTACGGLDTAINQHAIRFRVNNSSAQGFIWENGAESCLACLNGNTGQFETAGRAVHRASNPSGYNSGQLELMSAAGDVLLGFHAAGASAVSIIHTRGGSSLTFANNPISGRANIFAGPTHTNDWFRNESANTGIYSNYHGVGWQIQAGALVGYGTNITYVGELRSYGNVTAYYSDERLKRRIGNIENALDKVKQINGFRYVQNMLGNKLMGYNPNAQLAVSAQEMQKIAPEVVTLAPFDNDGSGKSSSGENYLTVQYERIVPILIEAIKELAAKVEKLEGGAHGRQPA